MLHLWPQLHREPGPFVWNASAYGNCVPESCLRMGCNFRIGLRRKLCPGIWLQRGMHFPVEASSGNGVPEFGLGTGRAFRPPAIRKVHPVLSAQFGTWFPRVLPTGKCVPVWWAGGHKLSSSYSSISLSHVGSAVCRIPAVCSFLASIPAERTSFMVKRSRGWP